MDSVESGSGPERDIPMLTQGELGSLFEVIARTLIKKGSYKADPGVYTPESMTEALCFRIDLDPSLVTAEFYVLNDIIHIEVGEAFFTYLTPHSLDKSEVNEPESSVYLGISGRIKGSDTKLTLAHLITRDEIGPDLYIGTVECEYERNNIAVDNEVVMIDNDMVMLSSYHRKIHFEDAQKIRRLLDRL